MGLCKYFGLKRYRGSKSSVLSDERVLSGSKIHKDVILNFEMGVYRAIVDTKGYRGVAW